MTPADTGALRQCVHSLAFRSADLVTELATTRTYRLLPAWSRERRCPPPHSKSKNSSWAPTVTCLLA